MEDHRASEHQTVDWCADAALENPKRAHFPEVVAGGYTRMDGTIEFYSRINALMHGDMIVLDLGAGRGRAIQEDAVPWRRSLQTLRGKCRRLIGVDVDDAVLTNPGLDEAHAIESGEKLPCSDESVDLIVSDATFEHVADPKPLIRELERVLKPGGWLCARTPNRWGYIGLGANLVPNRWHVSLLRHLQPGRKEMDVFPTTYLLNTRRALRRSFPPDRWQHCIYGHFAEPAYFGRSVLLWALILFLYRLTPPGLAPTWMIFLRKRG